MRRVDVEHLLGGDDLNTVRIHVEAKLFAGNLLDGVVATPQRGKIPIGTTIEQGSIHQEVAPISIATMAPLPCG